MKLKLNTSIPMPPPDPPNPQTASTPGGGKLKLKLTQTPTPGPTDTPTSKPGKKKRKAEDGEPGSTTKKVKASKGAGSAAKPQILRLKSAKPVDTPTTAAQHLKFNFKGKPPQRPNGVGYDSEAEDAEADPSIEENIVLRMKPGPDCDLVRKAIEERTLGISRTDGGVQVTFRFFGRDGRRAAVTVQDRTYAAVLVDLPCIIESMKSWDKKGWWKSADICQMLLVLEPINDPELARTIDLPAIVDQKTWQWPHGLTPPLHNVRKRRFRKRVSYRTIEAAENEVERLLAEDQRIENLPDGQTSLEIMDLDETRRAQEEEDAEGDFDDSQLIQPQEEEEDQEAMEARLAEELGGWDDDEDTALDDSVLASAQSNGGEVTVETPAIADPGVAPTTAASSDVAPDSGAPETPENDDGDEEDDEDDEDGSVEDDDGARERAEDLEFAKEDIANLETTLKQAQEKLANAQNPIFRQRFIDQIKGLEADLAIKRRAAGQDDEDE